MSRISWSTLKIALECPRQLQYYVQKYPVTTPPKTFYTELGIVVQFVFEMYYKKGVYAVPHGPKPATIQAIVSKVLESPWFKQRFITYTPELTEEMFKKLVRDMAESGRAILGELNLLDKKVGTEEWWNVRWRGFTLVGCLDFVYEVNKKVIQIYDGKGHTQQNADEGQLKFYSLMATMKGLSVERMGFLYWRHGYKSVGPFSEVDLKKFLDEKVVPAVALVSEARTGVKMPARPEPSKCNWCSWKNSCPDSPYFVPQQRLDEGMTTF